MTDAAASAPTANPAASRIVRTVFFSLVLDLLAFTLPLPLFPRLIAWYVESEGGAALSGQGTTLLARLLAASHAWRAQLLAWGSGSIPGSAAAAAAGGMSKNWDVVLLGGAMGSLFSLCQCVISPWLGALSDRYGRRRVLLGTMLGNILSAVVWMRSTTFSTYLLSRIIGGLSEGNVQLCTAIISDVTTPLTRSRSLAMVGIAFSICFTLGPSFGAYLASRPLAVDGYNIFFLPAAISLALLLIETTYLYLALPETRHLRSSTGGAVSAVSPPHIRLARLRKISSAHGLFLLFFSGAEFTLTFLTYDLLSYTNAQNGLLLSFIGILSASLQARYVRPRISRSKGAELVLARSGIISCVLALALLSSLPLANTHTPRIPVLYAAAACLAYTSATVVSGLTAAAAACCDDENGPEPRLHRGRALGGYRSRGQLGRAVGPILASSVYWLQGPSVAYAGLAACLVGVVVYVGGLVREEKRERGKME